MLFSRKMIKRSEMLFSKLTWKFENFTLLKIFYQSNTTLLKTGCEKPEFDYKLKRLDILRIHIIAQIQTLSIQLRYTYW